MKIKNVNLEYWVFRMDFGTNMLHRFNILDGMAEEIAKNIRSSERKYDHIGNRDDLKEFLKKEFMFHYWCKAEMEYGVCDLFDLFNEKSTKEGKKLDVWYQIEPNLNMITDYVISKMNLKFD